MRDYVAVHQATGGAAEEIGRKAIGFEVNTKYYKAAIERMLNDAEIH